MKQANRNRLAQLQFSALTQLAKDKDANKLLASPIVARRSLFRAIPATLCNHASHVLPDHSVAALETQPVPLSEILKWHLAPNGGHLYFSSVKNGEKPLTISPHEDRAVVSSKQGAVKQLSYTADDVGKAIDRVMVADNYYTNAVKKLRDNQGTGKEEEDLAIVAREAGNLAMVHDSYALKELFFLKIKNQVNHDGFDTSEFDKQVKKARTHLPTTANPAHYLRHDDDNDHDHHSGHTPGM